MKRPRLTKLCDQRQGLLAKIEMERGLLRDQARELRSTLIVLETGVKLVNKIKHNPLFSLGSIVALAATFILQRKRVTSLFQKSMSAWLIWRNVAPIVKLVLGRKTKTESTK